MTMSAAAPFGDGLAPAPPLAKSPCHLRRSVFIDRKTSQAE
jgi:hypothetical protein